jgi:DNA-nicking Smr family endonuclease
VGAGGPWFLHGRAKLAGLQSRTGRVGAGSDPGEPAGTAGRRRKARRTTVKLKLDLHDVYNKNDEIDRALRGIIREAVDKKATLVEIIPGKGSGQLKKRVLRFLDQKEIKALYHRIDKDSKNFGRIFVHFRW